MQNDRSAAQEADDPPEAGKQTPNEVNEMESKEKKKEPIYEKLAPGEVLIISKDADGCLEVAENIKGKLTIRKVCPIKEH
jgi:hypothetical protein